MNSKQRLQFFAAESIITDTQINPAINNLHLGERMLHGTISTITSLKHVTLSLMLSVDFQRGSQTRNLLRDFQRGIWFEDASSLFPNLTK